MPAEESIDDLLASIDSLADSLEGKQRGYDARYLPKMIRGQLVMVKAGENLWRLDNSRLKSPANAIAYRASKDMADKVSEEATFGYKVEGTDEGDGWIKIMVKQAGDDIDDAGVEVEEHLKDAVEGSLRLKRLLSRDEGPGKKKIKVDDDPQKTEKINQLLAKWTLLDDQVIRHTAEQCTRQEIEELLNGSYIPPKFHEFKSAAELFAKYMGDFRERKMVGSMSIDVIQSFRFRWKLDLPGDKLLRSLSHKELRYVFNTFDGSKTVQEVAEEARQSEPMEESLTLAACPDLPCIDIMPRFNRLELIDPAAEAAVFGDANLTFAKLLAKHRKALCHAGRVVATTFEDLPTLRERYQEIDESIRELKANDAEVYHEVDCTRIALDSRFKIMEGSFGAVYYNFPHSGAIQGFFDGHPIVNWRHENLMRLFFRALRSFVKPGGFVKVSSNAGATGVRYSYIVDSAITNEFLHIETMPFLQWCLHRYGRSYGDKRDTYKRPDAQNNQSYNAQRADADMVYCFCYAPTGAQVPKQMVRLPPTLSTIQSCVDGPFKNLQPPARKLLASKLHQRFITEVGGTHVG